MAAKYILAALSVVFLIVAATGIGPAMRSSRAARRTWLLVGLTFGAVALWLAYH